MVIRRAKGAAPNSGGQKHSLSIRANNHPARLQKGTPSDLKYTYFGPEGVFVSLAMFMMQLQGHSKVMSLHTCIPLPFFCVCDHIFIFFYFVNHSCPLLFIQLDGQQIVLGTRIVLLLTDVAYAVQVLHKMRFSKFRTF